jgi:hypothetical protein
MKPTILGLLMCLLAGNVIAQKTWKPARLLAQSGDTLRGEVLFEDWDRSPSSIEFRSAGSSSSIAYTPDNIKGFSIPEGNLKFVSKWIAIKYYIKTPVDQHKSPVVREFKGNAFVEVLLRNETVALYSYTDSEKDERFFLEKNNQLTELINIDYTTSFYGKYYRISKRDYRDQLKQILSECSTLKTKGINYDAKALLKILNAYDACSHPEYKATFEQPNNHDLVYYGITMGTSPTDYPYHVGLNLQMLSEKKFNNRFMVLESGWAKVRNGYYPTDQNHVGQFYLGIYVGTYFGIRALRPCVFTGFSTMNGFLDSGVGLAYKKKLALSMCTGLVNSPVITDSGNYSIKFRLFF